MITVPFERLLTRQEVAEILRVSTKTVRRLEQRGSLPRVELSGAGIRYLRKDLDAFISQRRVEKALW